MSAYVGVKRRTQRRMLRKKAGRAVTLRDAARCRDKVSFPHPLVAHRQAADIFVRTGRVLRVYRCRICGAWHHTSMAPRGA